MTGLAHPEKEHDMATIRKILYPTDFSEHSLAALPWAIDLAQRYSAELHCVHVVDIGQELPVESSYLVPLIPQYVVHHDEIEQAAKAHLRRFVALHMPDLQNSVKQAILSGKPFVQIVRYAHEQQIDLIVLGAHGHSALVSMLLGGVAEKVLRKAPCAVLIVRHPDYRFEPP
jgi:nucleotide-binding universal stress UspA family protein